MAVLVGLVASECENDTSIYHSYDLCIEECDFPRSKHKRIVGGDCIRWSMYITRYKDIAVTYHYCWKCIPELAN